MNEKHIELTIRCQGCLKLIVRPRDADMDLFRNGVHVHGNEECIHKAAMKLQVIV